MPAQPAREPGLGKKYLHVIFLWNPITAAVLTFVLGSENRLTSWLCSTLIGAVVSSTCFLVVGTASAIDHRLHRRRGAVPPRRSVFFWVSISVSVMPFGLYLGFKVARHAFRLAGYSLGGEPGFDNYKYGLFLGTLIFALFLLWRLRGDAELRLKESENQRLQAQLSALAAQMNPHFLFNSLNTVAALIPTSPDRAEDTLVRLSEVYRGILDSSRRTLHALSDELGLCRAYLDVEKARFGERLTVSIDLEAGLEPQSLQIPALALQPLVENAVKHGLSGKTQGGRVDIRARTLAGKGGTLLELVVEDDGVGLGASTRKGAGAGISTCRQRLELLHGDHASVEVSAKDGGGTRAVLRLPVTRVPA